MSGAPRSMNISSIKNLLPVTLLVLLICSCGQRTETEVAEDHRDSNDSMITRIMNEGMSYYDVGDYLKSRETFDRANSLLGPSTDTIVRIQFLFNSTELLKRQGEYEECISSYYEAAKLAELLNDSARLGLSYYNISATQLLLRNMEEAGKYNLMAQEIFKDIQDEERLMNCYVQSSVIHRNLKHIGEAKKYLEKAITYNREHNLIRNLAICLNNYGNLLFGENDIDQAIRFYLKAASMSERLNDHYSLAIRLGNIGESYLIENQLDSAKLYIDSSMSIAQEIDAKETILYNLERLVNYHKKSLRLDSALAVTQRLIQVKTELLKMESSDVVQGIEEKYKNELGLIQATNTIKLLEKDRLVVEQKQARANLIMYFVVSVLLLIVGISYILYQKQKRIRSIDLELHAKEREVLESRNRLDQAELRNKDIEKHRLEEELEFKRQELMTFSLNISEREKFLGSLKSVFSKFKPGVIPKEEALQELKGLLYNISGDGRAEIHNRIEALNSSFHFNLKTKYPNLNEDDIRLASLLVLGLSSKEISNTLIIEPKSVDMKRYRLKKKLNLDPEIDLKSFLENL